MSEILDARILATIAGKTWKTSGRAGGAVAGRHASGHHGHSTDFSQHRQYAAGDDIKNVDWKLFARSERFFIKQFRAETNARAYIMLDASASMDFPKETGAPTKFDYARKIAAAAAYVFAAAGDAAGLLLARHPGEIFIPPQAGWERFDEIISALKAASPSGKCLLAESIDLLAVKMKKRSLFVLISDLMEERESVTESVRKLALMRHECRVIQILDAGETSFDADGPVTLRDAETLEETQLDAGAASDYAQRFAEEFSILKNSLSGHTSGYDVFFTRDAPEKNLARLLV